jgi:hypothetical protein
MPKMHNGTDERPTPGPSQAEAGSGRRRGPEVRVDPADRQPSSLSALLSEWESLEDAEAYDGL